MPKEYLQNIAMPPSSIGTREFMFLEDFEGSFIWSKWGTGTDFLAAKSPKAAHSGNYGAILRTKTTTPAINDTVNMSRNISLGLAPVIELLVTFLYPTETGGLEIFFSISMSRISDNRMFSARLKITTADKKVYLETTDETYVEVGTLNITEANAWFTVGMAFDRVNLLFKALEINEQRFPVDTIPPTISEDYQISKALTITLATKSAAQREMYVDNIIIRNLPT